VGPFQRKSDQVCVNGLLAQRACQELDVVGACGRLGHKNLSFQDFGILSATTLNSCGAGSENKQQCSENVWSGSALCFATVKESYMFTRENKFVDLRNRFGTNDYERLPKIMRFWNGWSTPAIIHSKQNCGQMNPKPEGHWAKQRRLKEERAARMRSVAEQNSGVWWNASVFF